jgi:hypothetical protein
MARTGLIIAGLAAVAVCAMFLRVASWPVAGATGTGPTMAVGAPGLISGSLQVPIVASTTAANPFTGFSVHLRWDSSIFRFVSANAGGSIVPNPFCPSASQDADGAGATFGCVSLGVSSVTDPGLLATILLSPVGSGCSLLHLFTFGAPNGGDANTGTFTVNSADQSVQSNAYADGAADTAGAPCVPPTATPNSTATSTPTQTATPTQTPTPTATGTSTPAPTATPVGTVIAAPPQAVMLVNQGLCTALVSLQCFPASGRNGLDFGAPPGPGDQNLLNASNALGTNDNIIEPDDFAAAAQLSAGQVHQLDGSDLSFSSLMVIAFVRNIAPVTFHASEGFWDEGCSRDFGLSYGGAPAPGLYTCTGVPGPNLSASNPDPDCGGPNVSAAAPYGPDHVVVATLLCTLATCPDLGSQTISVEQAGFITSVPFTVVGERVSVQMFRIESDVQAGVPVAGTLSNRGAPSCTPPSCTPVRSACPFSLASFGQSGSPAEKAIVIARALDVNGTSIAGAWFDWTVDNAGVPTNPLTFETDGAVPTNFDAEGMLSNPLVPTLDMGTFGFGAPNILCAPEQGATGTVTVRATLASVAPGGLTVDPGANSSAFGEVTFNVHDLPTVMKLSATPQALVCDGTAATTISALLTDSAGFPAIAGSAVHFAISEISVGGGAPAMLSIDAVTDRFGIATAAITPPSSVSAMVVTGSSLGASSATSISCLTPTATPTSTPTSTPTPPPSDTAVPTATSTPSPAPCPPFGQRVRLVVGILHRLGVHIGQPRYQPRYDLNGDGVIDMQDLRLALSMLTCGARAPH